MIRNVYNTTDPKIWLKLKRQEADTLLDIISAFTKTNFKPKHLFKISQNALIAQLGVRKMKFVYKEEEFFIEGISRGLGKLSDLEFAELPLEMERLEVSEELHPALHRRGIEYVVPIMYRNTTSAWFLVAEFADSEIEKQNDLIFIETLGHIISSGLENHFLINKLVAQESLKRELEVAGQIQTQLLEHDFSDIVGAEISAMNVQHSQVGGDFFDVVTRVEKGFFVIIADVSGKGIAAALLMANLQAHIRALILSETELESVIQKLHASLMKITKGDRFVTLFMAHIRTPDGEMDYINAGHNPPLLIQGGQVIPLEKGTIPLGIIDLPPGIEEGTIKLNKGDSLFLYTDGLAEQMNPYEEILGDDRVLETLEHTQSGSPDEIIDKMKTLRTRFAQGTAPSDDITMLCVRFTED